MAMFQVPQFIDQKAKIVGQLTLRQFGFLAVAGVISLISYNLFNLFLWIMISIIVGSIGVALAFVKVNGRDLFDVAVSAFWFLWRPRTYTWQRTDSKETIDTSSLEKIEAIRKKMGLQERLKSAAFGVIASKKRDAQSIRGEQSRNFQTVSHLTGEREKARRVDY